MRELIRFDRRIKARQAGGVIKGDFAPLCGPYAAEKRPVRGYEQASQARIAGHEVFELRMRGCEALRGVTTNDRAIDARPGRDASFNILAKENPDGRGAEYIFTVEQGGSDG